MLPFPVYIYLKKYSTQSLAEICLQASKFLNNRLAVIFLSLWIILLVLIPISSKSQNLHLNYKITQGGDEIGWLRLEKNIIANRSNLILVSEIKTRFFFLITVSAKETSTFENGKLIFSSQYRKTNGDTKLDKQTRLVADKYEVLENGGKENLNIACINSNLLNLYFQEPVAISQVYCDNHKCFSQLIRTDDGGYKVKFPDGNSNCFYYTRGICTKIKISHTFYSAEIILKP